MNAPPEAPFRRHPFPSLPEQPRLPHAYADAEPHEEVLFSSVFGAHRVHWKTYGQGPPLLLVHGLMTHSYSWRYALPALGARYTCYLPDLVGAGRTEAPHSHPYTPEAVATWIGEFMDRVGIRGCPAIGNSMGGYLCMQLALRQPDAFSCLISLHGPGLPTPRMWALRAAMSVPGAYAILRGLVQRDPERWVHRNVHYYDESLKSLEEAREYALPLRSPEGVRAFGRYLHETLDPFAMRAFASALGKGFPIPLLLLYAETDPMVPPEVGRRLSALLPQAELVWLPQASHFAHVDAVPRFVEASLAFFDRHRG